MCYYARAHATGGDPGRSFRATTGGGRRTGRRGDSCANAGTLAARGWDPRLSSERDERASKREREGRRRVAREKRVRMKKMIGQDLRYKKKICPPRAPVRPYDILSPGAKKRTAITADRGGFCSWPRPELRDEKDS